MIPHDYDAHEHAYASYYTISEEHPICHSQVCAVFGALRIVQESRRQYHDEHAYRDGKETTNFRQ